MCNTTALKQQCIVLLLALQLNFLSFLYMLFFLFICKNPSCLLYRFHLGPNYGHMIAVDLLFIQPKIIGIFLIFT